MAAPSYGGHESTGPSPEPCIMLASMGTNVDSYSPNF